MGQALGSLLWLLVGAPAPEATVELPATATADEASFARAAPELARSVLATLDRGEGEEALDARWRLQLVAGDTARAVDTLRRLRELRRPTDPISADGILLGSEIYGRARLRQKSESLAFEEAYRREARATLRTLDDKAASYVLGYLADEPYLVRSRADLQRALNAQSGKARLGASAATSLLRNLQLYEMAEATQPLSASVAADDDQRRYLTDDQVRVRTLDGATLSATVFRKQEGLPSPAVLLFTIYPDQDRNQARDAAAHGYVGVVADARGKRLSPDPILPYEHEVDDVNAVIDWIARQPWSNEKVGMWGNSYGGFAQWAATKKLHPALKTIVPSAAAIPGLGLPMENNVFLNANYGWAFYVANNRMLDERTYSDAARWSSLPHRWYESGRPYREIDQVDGTPNPLLQRWIAHPSYDAYWQRMVPYRADFSAIKIPVLTLTGYYDDGQISALHYFREHQRYGSSAEHYLLIGPYQHFSVMASRKPRSIDGFAIDPVARINTKEIVFQWMDHVMRGGPKPSILQDRINFQVMGANEWRHAPSLEKMSQEELTLYLSPESAGGRHRLVRKKPAVRGFVEQTVDLADRKASTNNYYYPSPLVLDKLELTSGAAYLSEPFEAPASVSGLISGEIKATINKRDFDLSLVVYEVLPDGKLFHLTYFLGRASYARDMSRRRLLSPGRLETIPFDRTRLVSKQLEKGSRLLVVVNVNKNAFAQVNHGTGKDVSEESILDAGSPLRIRWHSDSFVRIPITR